MIRTVSSALGAQVAIAVVTATSLVASAPAVTSRARAPAATAVTGDPQRVAAALLRIPAHSGFVHAFWMAAAASLVALVAVALTPARGADPAVVTEKK